VFSSDIAATKPSPDAYSAACELLAVEPGGVLFIDDKAANVEGAGANGLNAIRYTTPGQLHHDLTSFDLLDPE
jgi:HAD superfamily hydrolase (TIGR01509 family)